MVVGVTRRRAVLYGLILTTACFALADEIADVALTWVIVSHTGSAGWLGVAGALGMIPLVVGAFFGGALVDRIGVRRTALLAGCLGLAVAIAIPVLIGLMGIVLPLLLVSIFAAELFDTPAELAIEAQLPELARFGGMPLERLNALDELVETLAGLAGPLLAGIAMTHLGTLPTLWLVAAITAAGVAVLWCALPRRPRARKRHPGGTHLEAIKEGFRLIWNTPVLRWIISFAALLSMLLASMETVLAPLIVQQSGWSALEYGWILAAASAGTAVGMATYAWKGHSMRPRAIVAIGTLGIATAVAALALLSEIEQICLAVAIGSAAAGPMSPLLNTQVQRHAPRTRRGSILGVATGLVLLCLPVGFLAIGLLAELLGAQMTLIGIAVVVAGSSVLALMSPTVTGM
ncbi:MAG: MFS transporter, partial [Methyloceanibacter sp.]|nr:MFS transporter [Methyloceanibacter sp.]